jgi:hypothetical protein
MASSSSHIVAPECPVIFQLQVPSTVVADAEEIPRARKSVAAKTKLKESAERGLVFIYRRSIAGG